MSVGTPPDFEVSEKVKTAAGKGDLEWQEMVEIVGEDCVLGDVVGGAWFCLVESSWFAKWQEWTGAHPALGPKPARAVIPRRPSLTQHRWILQVTAKRLLAEVACPRPRDGLLARDREPSTTISCSMAVACSADRRCDS